jgi:hypothetical protein
MELGSLVIRNIQKVIPDTHSNKNLKVTKYRSILVAVRSKSGNAAARLLGLPFRIPPRA